MNLKSLPLTRAQLREVDRRAVEKYGMHPLVLMENAGRGCAEVLEHLGIAGPVVIVCGKGNNAGDGLVLARHLQIRGYESRVLLLGKPADLSDEARANFNILQHTEIPLRQIASDENPAEISAQLAKELAKADWIVDALLGTGARGAPRPPIDIVLDALGDAAGRRLAIDLPSGLDCDAGKAARGTFRADHTCTFVATKPGFSVPGAENYTGTVHLVEIGVPPKLLDEVRAS